MVYPTSLNQRNIVAISCPMAASTRSKGNSWNRIGRPVAFVRIVAASGIVNSSPAKSIACPRKSLGRTNAAAANAPISHRHHRKRSIGSHRHGEDAIRGGFRKSGKVLHEKDGAQNSRW